MTPSGPDEVITPADLLFGSTEGAHEALTRHVMSVGWDHGPGLRAAAAGDQGSRRPRGGGGPSAI